MALLQQNPGVLFSLKLTDTGNHDFGSSDRGRLIYWFACTNITTNTPALTIALYDGSTTTYLRNALAMSTKERVVFDYPIPLPPGTYLRIASSAGNEIDVIGTISP